MTPTREEPSVSLIYLTECEDILIEDVSLVDSHFWAVHLHWSEHIRVRGIKITSDLERGVNSDGLDIDGCKDVIVSDCIISTADDAIVLKTTDRNGKHRPCENVTIANCVIRNTNRGLGIFIRDGGTASNIIFSNITMECNRKDFFWWGDGDALRFVVLQRSKNSKIGSIQNVLVKDVMAEVQGTSLIEGFRGKNIQDITLSNVSIRMRKETTVDKRVDNALLIKGVDHLEMSNVKIDWDEAVEKKWKSAVVLEQVRELTIQNFEGRQGIVGVETPTLLLNNVQNARISDSKAMRGTGVFLMISGSESKKFTTMTTC